MPLGREEKIALLQRIKSGNPLSREEKINILQTVKAPDNTPKHFYDKEAEGKKIMSILMGESEGILPEYIKKNVSKETIGGMGALKGAEMASKAAQAFPSPFIKGIAPVVGAGLGYALAKEPIAIKEAVTGERPVGTLGQETERALGEATTGATAEMGAQMIPIVAGAAMKAPGVAVKGIKKLSTKEPIKFTGTQVTRPSEALQVLRQERDAFTPTPQTEAQNMKFQELGLEPATPVQLQPKAFGEPTPAQYTESLLRARSPELYNQQLKQVESYKNLLKKYQELGDVTQEVAGQKIKEGIRGAEKEAGKKIGKNLELISENSVFNKKKMPDLSYETKRLNTAEQSQLNQFAQEFADARTMDDLAALNSKMAQVVQMNPAYKGTVYDNALNKIKSAAKGIFIDEMKAKGIKNPERAYEQYAKAENLFNDTLRGTLKTGKSKDVVKKITSSPENIKQFKETIDSLESPELLSTVKSNWLSDIMGDQTGASPGRWIGKWNKSKSAGIAQELLNPEEIAKIDLLARYYETIGTTMTKTTNPPRSGIMGVLHNLATQSKTQTTVNFILGDELKYAKVLREYKNALNSGEYNIPKQEVRRSLLPYAEPNKND